MIHDSRFEYITSSGTKEFLKRWYQVQLQVYLNFDGNVFNVPEFDVNVLKQSLLYIYVPLHCISSLQTSSMFSEPEQSFPPNLGNGLLHWRIALFRPPVPHGWEHDGSQTNSLHPPWTINKRNVNNIWTKNRKIEKIDNRMLHTQHILQCYRQRFWRSDFKNTVQIRCWFLKVVCDNEI